MAKFKVNQSVYIKHQGAIPWRIVQIDTPERGDDALYHLRDSRNTYEREFGRNLIGTDEPNASARASNSTLNTVFRVGDKVKWKGKDAKVVDPSLHGRRMPEGYVFIEYWDKNDKAYYAEGVRQNELVRNATLNARFKVGDKILTPSGKRAHVTSVHSSDYMMVQLDEPPYGEDEVSMAMSRKATNSAINERVRIGDAELRGATTATLDFAKDRRGDYILAGDEVVADTGDGIDTYKVLKVLPGNKVKIGDLGVEVATVDAKTVSVTRKHGILKRDGDTVVLKNAKWQINYFDGGYDFVDAPNQGDAKRKAADMEKKSGRGVRSVIVAENYPKPYKDFVIRSNSTNPVVANAIAWNFSARAKQEATKVVKNLVNAVDSLNLVVIELEKSDDPNDKKMVDPVKRILKDVSALPWKLQALG